MLKPATPVLSRNAEGYGFVTEDGQESGKGSVVSSFSFGMGW